MQNTTPKTSRTSSFREPQQRQNGDSSQTLKQAINAIKKPMFSGKLLAIFVLAVEVFARRFLQLKRVPLFGVFNLELCKACWILILFAQERIHLLLLWCILSRENLNCFLDNIYVGKCACKCACVWIATYGFSFLFCCAFQQHANLALSFLK